jgi:hypothetical protein
MKNIDCKKDIKIVISSILIFMSFFIWYYYSEINNDTNKNTKEQNYVNIEILKTKIKISKNKNTKITINWNILEGNIINLIK